MDSDFDLIGVINYRTNKFYFSEKDLDHYFIPKNPKINHTLEHLLRLQRGVNYTKTASHYLFRKTGVFQEN
ncbi:MAG: hypothetical protein JW776_14735 [Candidatus Lokiarchaeota archaeon]|nr:hypothetical protein [Candidatus Lokiarchaeota archaeon]